MKISVCTWSACKDKFSHYMITRIKRDIEKFDLKNVVIEESPCMWMCKEGPNAKIDSEVCNRCNPAILSQRMFKKIKK